MLDFLTCAITLGCGSLLILATKLNVSFLPSAADTGRWYACTCLRLPAMLLSNAPSGGTAQKGKKQQWHGSQYRVVRPSLTPNG